MNGHKRALPKGNPKGPKRVCADRSSDRAHKKYTKPAFDIQEPRAFLAAVKRLLCGAFYFEHLTKGVR